MRAWRRFGGAWALAWAVCLQPADAAEPLRLAVARGPVSLPFYVAADQGHFAAAGVTVEMVDCASGRACFERLAAGQADAATAAELLVTLASFSDARSAVLASVSSSVHQIKLVARQDHDPSRGDGWLRGKRVGTVDGTSAQYYLDAWLLYHGIAPDAVTRVSLPPHGLASALARGEIDAVAIWEPHAADSQARWAAHAGLVGTGRRPGNLLRVIEPALLRKAVPGAVGLVH